MELRTKTADILKEKSDAAVFTAFEDEGPKGLLSEADRMLGGIISRAFKTGEFSGKKDEVIFFHTPSLKGGPDRVFVAGLGKKDKFSRDVVMRAAGSAAAALRRLNLKDITVAADIAPDIQAKDAANLWTQGTILGLYSFDTFKAPDPKKKELRKITFITMDKRADADARAGAETGKVIADSVAFARDMINTPSNEMTPTIMAEAAKKMAREFGLKLKVLEEKDARKLGMGAYLGVAKGSSQPPKFLVLEYGRGKKRRPVALVGKGITFDSGGISIKPVDGMEKMKYDMAGGAAVLGVMRAVAALKLPVNVVAVVPVTENMPDGGALKPGDVVRAMNGKTIEIISTDAEGRLVLADGLCYAARYKPRSIIDIATLTGACVIALGDQAVGMMGNDRGLMDRVRMAGDAVHERVWELPMWDEYLERMKGDVTDLKNVGGRQAATVAAGKFLEEFVEKGTPWVHLDIAGTAWEEKGGPYTPKGAIGTGVRMLTEFLMGSKD